LISNQQGRCSAAALSNSTSLTKRDNAISAMIAVYDRVVVSFRKNNPVCHSEASLIGEESAFCQCQNSRFLAHNAALRNDNSLEIFKLTHDQ
jgi:hypothetical protein